MIEGQSAVVQTLLATTFTWGVTALGAATVFFATPKRIVLDCSLGFSAGVMLAASFWCLLGPAIDLARHSKLYGEDGEHAYIPAVVGFLFGAAFLSAAEQMFQSLGLSGSVVEALTKNEPGQAALQEDHRPLRKRVTRGKKSEPVTL